MSIEIRLPEALALASGNLSWFGDINQGAELEVISAGVRATKVGNWALELRTSINPETQAGLSMYPDWRKVIYVSVFHNSAEWSKRPPSYRGYGASATLLREGDPLSNVQLYLAISHAPLLNEPAELLCTISPRVDFPDFEAKMVLPEGAALVSGNLEWTGDLTADVPVNFWAKIIFEETGNWQIDAGAWRWIEEKYSWHTMDSKFLVIGVGHSEFGEPPKEDRSDLPIPPAIPPTKFP